ncbi:MAG: M1 family aminopeptidase [Kofleriaceae bacterium]
MRARLCLAVAVALVGCGDDTSSTPDARPAGTARVAVVGYDYTVDLTSRAVTAAVNLRLLDDGNCVQLASRAPGLDLATVTLGDAAATATADGVTLTACGAGWSAGTELTLTSQLVLELGTWGASQVGYSITNDATGKPLTYLLSWVEQCDRLGPCDPSPGVFAHYRFTVHHPADTIVVCPGTRVAGADVTTCTFDLAGGPTYSTFGIAASPSWQETDLGTWGAVRTTLFDRAGSGVQARIDVPYHQGFLAWMVETFGPYPYGTELRIAVGPTYWSGFEHPGNIVLDDGLARPIPMAYTRPVTHTLNHELAHQWAGDQTTLATTYDFVWKEAMAEYLAFVYEDATEPATALATARAWKSFAVGAGFYPVPEDAPRPTLLTYYGEVYGPGPMILFRQIEAMSSRAAVIAALQTLLGQERVLSVDDVVAALEASTGLDLATYVDVWIRGSGAPAWPTFRLTVSGTAPDEQLTVTETTPGGVLHGCDFSVEVRGANADEVHKVWIARGVDGTAAVTVPTGVPWPTVTTVLDVDAQCLAYRDNTIVAAPRHPPGWTPWTTRP